MPTIDVTTKVATQVWASPDGNRKIYELQLEYEGKPVKAKTYSDAIATVGWKGTVETYEKAGRNGAETFVKQPPKEGAPSGGGGYSGGRSFGGRPQADPFTMYLSYAKDLAIECVTVDNDGKPSFNDKLYAGLLDAVSAGGFQLYSSRPEAGDKPQPKEPTPETQEPVDLSVVDKVFSPDQEQAPELPWPKTT